MHTTNKRTKKRRVIVTVRANTANTRTTRHSSAIFSKKKKIPQGKKKFPKEKKFPEEKKFPQEKKKKFQKCLSSVSMKVFLLVLLTLLEISNTWRTKALSMS
jgi:hypothetical protein